MAGLEILSYFMQYRAVSARLRILQIITNQSSFWERENGRRDIDGDISIILNLVELCDYENVLFREDFRYRRCVCWGADEALFL
jgi:hypothetical protein